MRKGGKRLDKFGYTSSTITQIIAYLFIIIKAFSYVPACRRCQCVTVLLGRPDFPVILNQ